MYLTSADIGVDESDVSPSTETQMGCISIPQFFYILAQNKWSPSFYGWKWKFNIFMYIFSYVYVHTPLDSSILPFILFILNQTHIVLYCIVLPISISPMML